MRKTKLLLALLLVCAPVCRAQQRPISQDLGFIDYLIGNNFTTDALSWLDGNAYQPSDTLAYLRGLTLYTAGKLELAAEQFSKVPAESGYYDRSVFYGVVSDAYSGSYDRGLGRLEAYNGPYQELKYFEMAALSLLKDDKAGYKAAASAFTYSDYTMTEGERLFDKVYDERYATPQKSPWLAAGLSAAIPGLGKIYAGRKDRPDDSRGACRFHRRGLGKERPDRLEDHSFRNARLFILHRKYLRKLYVRRHI